jgi:hypothetical protein
MTSNVLVFTSTCVVSVPGLLLSFAARLDAAKSLVSIVSGGRQAGGWAMRPTFHHESLVLLYGWQLLLCAYGCCLRRGSPHGQCGRPCHEHGTAGSLVFGPLEGTYESSMLLVICGGLTKEVLGVERRNSSQSDPCSRFQTDHAHRHQNKKWNQEMGLDSSSISSLPE